MSAEILFSVKYYHFKSRINKYIEKRKVGCESFKTLVIEISENAIFDTLYTLMRITM